MFDPAFSRALNISISRVYPLVLFFSFFFFFGFSVCCMFNDFYVVSVSVCVFTKVVFILFSSVFFFKLMFFFFDRFQRYCVLDNWYFPYHMSVFSFVSPITVINCV